MHPSLGTEKDLKKVSSELALTWARKVQSYPGEKVTCNGPKTSMRITTTQNLGPMIYWPRIPAL